MADVTIRFKAESDRAQKDIGQLRSEVDRLEKEFGETRKAVGSVNRGFTDTNKNTGILSGSLGELRGVLGAIGFTVATQQIISFASGAFTAADRIENLRRGMLLTEGSAEAVNKRLTELNELAKFPALDPEVLSRYDITFKNLGNTSEENNLIFEALSKSITTFGGGMQAVNSVLLQYQQAQSKGTIEAGDFKIIVEQTSGAFIVAAEKVHGFTGGIDGMRTAFENSGKTYNEFMQPIWEELQNLPGADVDSFTNATNNLGIAWNLYLAEIGQTGSIGEAINALTGLIEKETDAWQAARDLGPAIKAMGDESTLAAIEVVILQKDVNRLNTALETAKEKYEDYIDDGVNPASASMQNLQRRIEFLEGRLTPLSTELDTLKTNLFAVEAPTTDAVEAIGLFDDTLGELHPSITDVRAELDPLAVTAGRVDAIFRSLDTAVHDTDVEMQALSVTAESAETIFEDSTGLVREWGNAFRDAKDPVLSLKEALDGVALDTPDITPPDLEIQGIDSPLEKIIEQSNAVNPVTKEVTDLAGSFDALRESTQAAEPSLDTLESKFDAIQSSVDGLPGGVSDFEDSLQLLSDNAPTILSGLFTVLGDLDSRFSGIGKTAAAIGSQDPVGFLASIPGLQQSVQSLLAPLDESDASVQQRVALSVRGDIAGSDLSEQDKQGLLTDLDNFIREVTIRYIRSLPEAFANATIAQQESSLGLQGFDFDYARDVAALQRLGVDFQQFGELSTEAASIDLSGVIETLGRLQELAASGRAGGSSSTKRRRGTPEQQVAFEDNEPVAAAPSAPGVVQQTQAAVVQASDAMVTVENLELAALDASATLLNESALALRQAASDHSLAAAAHTEAASAIVAAANQLAEQGGGDFRLTLELPDGAIRDIGNNLIQQQADGRLLGFGQEG